MRTGFSARSALFLGCLTFLPCTAAWAQTATFQTPANYAAQNGPLGVATADFNGDGRLDLVVGNAASSSISIFLGTGNGTFNAAGTAPIPNACAVSRLLGGDFNGDGKLDVLAICGFQSTVWVLPGLGTGQFGTAIATQLPDLAMEGFTEGLFRTAAVADFNGDGALDLVIGLGNGAVNSTVDVTLNIMLGNGDGTFKAPSASLLSSSQAAFNVAAADLDGDGTPDLAVTAAQEFSGAATLLIFHGNGDGTFQNTAGYAMPTSALFGVTLVADVNRDGVPDVITGGVTQASLSDKNPDFDLEIFLGAGGGTFNPGFTAGEPGLIMGLLAADFRGVGTPDLIEETLTRSPSDSPNYGITIRAGNGDGTFQSPVAIPGAASLSPWWPSLTTADWNGDGLPDIAFTSLPTFISSLANIDKGTATSLTTIVPVYQSLPQANIVVMLNAGTRHPTINAVQNPASNIPGVLPNGGIAQGSIFVLYGSDMGPAALIQPPGYPLPSTAGLGGTLVTITVNGTTVTAPLVYSWTSQVAAVLPSNTPLGAGTVTVTFNGVSSLTFPITVVQSNFGISTDPTGLYAAVTYANNQFVAQSNAAPPGTELVLWGTGLGPITSSDAVIPTTNVSASLSIQVWVGGVQAKIAYRGRSAEPGLDQINFFVPEGVSGCEVSIAVQTGNTLSNYATMAIAPNGGQCTDANAINSSFWSGNNSVTLAEFRISQAVSATAGISVNPQAQFLSLSASQFESQAPQLFGVISLGSCLVSINREPRAGQIFGPFLALNEGPSVTLTPPSGSALTLTPTHGVGDYTASPTPTSLLPAGQYTASNGAFSVNFTVAPFVTWTNQNSLANTAIDRTKPLTIQWSGAAAGTYIDIKGTTAFGSGTIQFECAAPASPGQFTIPPAVLLALPPEPGGTLQVSTKGGGTIQVPGFSVGVFSTSNASSVGVSWK